MLSVEIDNPQVEQFFHHSPEAVVHFLEEAIGQAAPSFVVSDVDEVRKRLEQSGQSRDLSDEECEQELERFFAQELRAS